VTFYKENSLSKKENILIIVVNRNILFSHSNSGYHPDDFIGIESKGSEV
jgi:hypothetical protein